MPSLDVLVAFVIATAVFACMPGPAMLYAVAQTMARGKRGGWLAALGIHLGGYVHVVAASLGLAVLLTLVPALYLAVKLAGAVYLVWLGVKLFLSKQGATVITPGSEGKMPRRIFWESIVVEMLNPKTALFYVAFLPQFTDPSAAFPVWLQLFILGTVVNFVFSSADVLCVLLTGRLAVFLRASRAALMVRRIGGGILIALGVKVALSRA